jgi:hypothetical protein
MLTRRELLALLASAPAGMRGEVSPLDKIAATWTPKSVGQKTAKYRADATVSLLGLNLFSRAGVGSATIRIDESAAADNARTVALWFAAGSAPDRTRGLNRLGYIQEVVVERGQNLLESAYFGFITSSKEESFAQAKAALGANAKDSVPYTAVEGSAAGRNCAYRLYEMLLPSRYDFAHHDEVIQQVKGLLARNEIQPARKESGAIDTPRTFLYAVRESMLNAQFLYNGKPYNLTVEKSADSKMGQQFAKKGMTALPDRVMRVNGTVQDVAAGEKTPFRLWFEQNAELPLRFEYKARTFLSLAFEFVPA